MSGYSPSEEDYLEALYRLQLENKVTRVKDVADALDVTMPSVAAAIRSLSKKGLVGQEKYRHIELTEKGEKIGRDVYERHKLIYTLLHEVLGLDPEVAEQDACQIEHCLSPQARERLSRMVEFTQACRDDKSNFIKRFMHFIRTGELPEACQGCPLEEQALE